MVSNEHGRIRTNHLPNVRRIQDDVSGTIYESQFIRNDDGKTTKSETRKNENTRIRNQDGHVNTSNDVERLSNENFSLSGSVSKESGPNYVRQLGQDRERIKR